MVTRLQWLAAATLLALSGWLHLAGASIQAPAFARGKSPAELWAQTPELLARHGFDTESHDIQTDDGYIITIHRIVPRNRSLTEHRTPLLAGHGLASCSEQWGVRNDGKNLMYELTARGFDVWLANYRGSFYGRKHIKYNIRQPKFWDFSWHESGLYDQPAFIDHILNVTGFKSMMVIGHSMSATVHLVTLMERPEYASKVRATMLLAPPAIFANPSGLMRIFGELFKGLPFIKTAYNYDIRNGNFVVMEYPLYLYCFYEKSPRLPLAYCRAIFELVAGRPQDSLDPHFLRLLMAHYPAGSSVRQVMHYGQSLMKNGDFRKYDFGVEKNLRLYGTEYAPKYNLSAVTMDTYLYYGGTDNLVNYRDSEALARGLPNLKRLYKVNASIFNHVDFLIGNEGVPEFINTIISDIEKYI